MTLSWGLKKVKSRISDVAFIDAHGTPSTLTGSSLSLNFSIIDIGAVVSYRINNGENKPLPEKVRFSQFLSPGFSVGYGFKGIPLAINFGAQFTPELRDLAAGGTKSAFRFFTGLFYDLPLLNISKH